MRNKGFDIQNSCLIGNIRVVDGDANGIGFKNTSSDEMGFVVLKRIGLVVKRFVVNDADIRQGLEVNDIANKFGKEFDGNYFMRIILDIRDRIANKSNGFKTNWLHIDFRFLSVG